MNEEKPEMKRRRLGFGKRGLLQTGWVLGVAILAVTQALLSSDVPAQLPTDNPNGDAIEVFPERPFILSPFDDPQPQAMIPGGQMDATLPGWWVTLDVSRNGGALANLELGQATAATDNFDVGTDALAPPQAPAPNDYDAYFSSITDEARYPHLLGDYRAAAPTGTWRLVLRLTAGDSFTGTFGTANAQGRILTWQESDAAWTGAGLVHPLSDAISVTNSTGAVLTKYYVVRLGDSFTLVLSSGWNLISLPLVPAAPSPVALFGTNMQAIFSWDGRRYVIPTAMQAKTGYWVYLANPATVTVAGTAPADGSLIHLSPGWNLVGPVGAQTVPGLPVIASFGWDGTRYVIPAICVEGKGYWFYTNIATDLLPEPPEPLAALGTLPVPEPPNLALVVKDKAAAIQLGKALFWDMQLGSDGAACASCHFHAGTDNRTRNTISPGLNAGDTAFQVVSGANQVVTADMYPFHQRQAPVDRQSSAILRDANDVTSSAGVNHHLLQNIVPGQWQDAGTLVPDPVFNSNGSNVRRVAPRNTPTMINAIFFPNQFWDGRARDVFNGNNPFGELDMNSTVLADDGTGLKSEILRMTSASLASQAVGPPLSNFEMSYEGRTYAQLGKKMLSLRPLALQRVHAQDSVLGPLAAADKGLTVTYAQMIQAAFQPRYWSNTDTVVSFQARSARMAMPRAGNPRTVALNNGKTILAPATESSGTVSGDTFTQMEANFALFCGIAIQLYEATLVSDDSPFDRYAAGQTNALTDQQLRGLNVFVSGGSACNKCHGGALFSGAELQRIEQMQMAQGDAVYDDGFYNIGVTRTTDDVLRGGTAPFVNPLTGENFPLAWTRLAQLKRDGLLPAEVAPFVPDLISTLRVVANGTAKTPSLRNVELTGPYFHNGGAATLRQVVEFYSRGGNFPVSNAPDLHSDIHEIGQLIGSDQKKDELVAFLLALTDDRVRYEQAPFDHPELIIPNGADTLGVDFLTTLPAVGSGGRLAEGLPGLGTFLELSPFTP